MDEVKLNCYTIQIKESGKKKLCYLDDLIYNNGDTSNEIDFKDFFINFTKSFNGEFMGIKGTNNAVYIPSEDLNFGSEKRIIYGFMSGGRTGTGRTIKAMNNPDDEIFKVRPDHVDSVEYFYLIWFPKNSNMGLLIVQGLSSLSSAEVYRRLLKSHFSNMVSNKTIEISRYVPKGTVEKMREKGDINKISLRKQRLSPDIANHVLGTDFIDTDLTIEIVIKGLKGYTYNIKKMLEGEIFEVIKDLSLGETPFFTTPILEELGMDGTHEVSFEYEFRGKKATAKQSKGFKLEPYYYVDEGSFKRDPKTNLPTKESITSYCLDFFEMISKEMKGSIRR